MPRAGRAGEGESAPPRERRRGVPPGGPGLHRAGPGREGQTGARRGSGVDSGARPGVSRRLSVADRIGRRAPPVRPAAADPRRGPGGRAVPPGARGVERPAPDEPLPVRSVGVARQPRRPAGRGGRRGRGGGALPPGAGAAAAAARDVRRESPGAVPAGPRPRSVGPPPPPGR